MFGQWGRHQSGGLASTWEGDARYSSADATTVAAPSSAVRAAHVEFCQIRRMLARVPGRLVLTSRSVPVTQVRAPDSHDERATRCGVIDGQESIRQQPTFSWVWQVAMVRVPEPTTFRERYDGSSGLCSTCR